LPPLTPLRFTFTQATMRWRIRPIRGAGDFPSDGEAMLRPVPGLGGVNLVPPGSSETDLAVSAFHDDKIPPSRNSAQAPRPAGDDSTGADPDSPRESRLQAQPSGENGVSEDMATMVLDKSAMGVATARRQDLRPFPGVKVPAGLDPAGDAAVMLRVAAGDEASFNYLVEKYHRPIIHFLFRMVRNQAVAEELAQDVFLRVYRSRESYRAEARFTTWLYRIATNLAVNHARDTRHERSAQPVHLDAVDPETGTTPDVADYEPSVEQHMMRDERMAAIRKHVMALPERQRMAVLMHKYQGMDYRQIGEVLKLSESATKSLLFRAYQTLREKLKDFV
jgi:RNA polymerase sigma-70 factor, ECF subfamily